MKTIESPAAEISAELLDVNCVAAMLGCSPRHVYRLSDGGRMPAPLKIGTLCRWNLAVLRAWIDGGCKAIRAADCGRRSFAAPVRRGGSGNKAIVGEKPAPQQRSAGVSAGSAPS